MAALSASFSSPPAISKPKPFHILATHNSISPPCGPILIFRPSQSSRRRRYFYQEGAFRPKLAKLWEIPAKEGLFSLSEASPAEIPGEIVSTSDDGVSTVISALLFIAFVGLSILTIGVIYIAVSDFLQKREREKFEKEEASKEKKGGKNGKARTRARLGPRGFGEKVREDDSMDET